MHEMSLCEGIVQVLETESSRQHFSTVKTVWLEIGALAGVEIAALRFGFEVVSRNTLADGARLEIIEIPAQAWCMGCSQSVTIQQRYDACPECGSYQLHVTGGDAMRIKELEVE